MHMVILVLLHEDTIRLYPTFVTIVYGCFLLSLIIPIPSILHHTRLLLASPQLMWVYSTFSKIK